MDTGIKILGMIHDFDVEIVLNDVPSDFNVAEWVMNLKARGLNPRPRYQKKDDTPFEPFVGTVEKIEKTQTKSGKDMWVAHVRPDKSEPDDPDKPLVSFKFMNAREWRENDRVKVTKNDKGWLEGHEPESGQEPPF